MLNGVRGKLSLDAGTTDSKGRLKGQGEGTTDGEIRWPDVKVTVNGTKRALDLLMHPLTKWRGNECGTKKMCTAGGYDDLLGGFGMINVDIGKKDSEYEFEFRFVERDQDKSSAPVTVDDVYIEFFDIDRASDVTAEKIVVKKEEVADIFHGDAVDLLDEGGQYGFVALEDGNSTNNPSSLTYLSPDQTRMTARVHYQKKGLFSVKFGIKGVAGKGRNFWFSLDEC